MTISYSLPKLEEVNVTFTATVATYNRDKIWGDGKILRELTGTLEQFQKTNNFTIGKVELTMNSGEEHDSMGRL